MATPELNQYTGLRSSGYAQEAARKAQRNRMATEWFLNDLFYKVVTNNFVDIYFFNIHEIYENI